jgi:hypothetical protein
VTGQLRIATEVDVTERRPEGALHVRTLTEVRRVVAVAFVLDEELGALVRTDVTAVDDHLLHDLHDGVRRGDDLARLVREVDRAERVGARAKRQRAAVELDATVRAGRQRRRRRVPRRAVRVVQDHLRRVRVGARPERRECRQLTDFVGAVAVIRNEDRRRVVAAATPHGRAVGAFDRVDEHLVDVAVVGQSGRVGDELRAVDEENVAVGADLERHAVERVGVVDTHVARDHRRAGLVPALDVDLVQREEHIGRDVAIDGPRRCRGRSRQHLQHACAHQGNRVEIPTGQPSASRDAPHVPHVPHSPLKSQPSVVG